ncbi:MAG: DegT/DnrJ/EryC1/StrS family aminotransferase [Beijerinckiaceae bacterium]
MRVYARHHLDIGWRELASALTATLRDGSASPNGAIARLWPPDRHAVSCLSVRTAFDALLTEFHLPAGSEIVMTAINIAGMQGIAEHHGLVLRPVDIDPRTLAPRIEDVRAAVSSRTRLLLIAHLFGSRVDLAPFASLKRDDLLLVEDCAQGWTPDFSGSPEADISLFSFGPIKTLTALGGGIAVFRDKDLAAAFARKLATYPKLGSGWFARRVLKYGLLKVLSAPLPYGLISRLMRLTGRDMDAAINGMTRGFGQNPKVAQFRFQPPDAMVGLIARRLAAGNDLSARAGSAAALVAALPEGHVPGSAAAGHTFWVTPVLVDDPDAARHRLMAHGFDATRGTTSMRVIGPDADSAPAAAAMMRGVIYLPSPAHLPARKLEELRRLISSQPTA